jgi:hypothetical protein
MEKMNVILECDGKIVPLNLFVQKFLGNAILGMVGSLDKVKKNPKQVYIAIKKEVKR